MIDFHHSVRKSFFEALNGELTYDGSPVPVHDKKQRKDSDNNYYVVLSNINSNFKDNFTRFTRDVSIVIDVITKTQNSVASAVADDIAGQILYIVIPSTTATGLTAPATLQYLNLRLSSDNSLDLTLNPSVTVVRRLLTFNLDVVQK